MSALEPNIESHFKQLCQERLEGIEHDNKELYSLLQLCESPAEQLFLLHLVQDLRAEAVYSVPDHMQGLDAQFYGYPFLRMFDIFIALQQEVLVPSSPLSTTDKRYRVDFLITIRRQYPYHNLPSDELVKLVVEIDGHDYHERTKEQAKRDRSRDRRLTQAGYFVFRFTGSEVYNEGRDIIGEVVIFLLRRAEELVEQYGLIRSLNGEPISVKPSHE